MNIRYGRLCGIGALVAAAVLASGPLRAGQDVDVVEANAEDSLLGVHLIKSTFRDVLHKYGQPDEIQAGGPFAPTPPPSKANANGGGMSGPGMGGMGSGGGFGRGSGGPMMGKSMGGPGMGGGGPMGSGGGPGMGGGGGGGAKVPSKNGFPGDNGGGAGGGPGMRGGPMGSGGMGPHSSGTGSGGPMMGSPGSMGGPGGGLPGFGPRGQGGGAAGESEGEGEGLGTGTEQDANPPLKETTWWYHDNRKGLHMAFVFNRVGQVIQIGEYGPKKLERMRGVLIPSAGATKRGVVLGNSMGTVIGKYGWSLDGAHDADNVILRFGRSDKVAFQMVHNSILGITIGVTHTHRPVVAAEE